MLSLLVSCWVNHLQPQREAKYQCPSSTTLFSKLDHSVSQALHTMYLTWCHRAFFDEFLQAVSFQNALFDNLAKYEKNAGKIGKRTN